MKKLTWLGFGDPQIELQILPILSALKERSQKLPRSLRRRSHAALGFKNPVAGLFGLDSQGYDKCNAFLIYQLEFGAQSANE